MVINFLKRLFCRENNKAFSPISCHEVIISTPKNCSCQILGADTPDISEARHIPHEIITNGNNITAKFETSYSYIWIRSLSNDTSI